MDRRKTEGRKEGNEGNPSSTAGLTVKPRFCGPGFFNTVSETTTHVCARACVRVCVRGCVRVCGVRRGMHGALGHKDLGSDEGKTFLAV